MWEVIYAWRQTIAERDAAAGAQAGADRASEAPAFVPAVLTGPPLDASVIVELARDA